MTTKLTRQAAHLGSSVDLLQVDSEANGLHLPKLGLWLDAREPCLGPEKVFVSHAHSDHVAAHREVILSAPTAKLMQVRMPGTGFVHVLPFGDPRRFESQGSTCELTLLPAGHIFGSAMLFAAAGGQTLLYTGDFKLRRGLSAEVCQPRPADILIMETTYGRPHYVFPPGELVLKGIIRFCREALDNDETAVLFGYSLGKSQELLCGLAEARLPLTLHGAVHKLTEVYQQFGQCFPDYERYEAGSARGKVLICPPNVINSAMLRKLGKTRTAILTGWAVDPNCRFRYGCDAAFPLSDHADYPELIEMVRRVQPEKVYTLHGFAADFAKTLRDLGYQAQSISEDEQLTMAFDETGSRSRSRGSSRPDSGTEKGRALVRPLSPPPIHQVGNEAIPAPSPASHSFYQFAATCSRIAGESRKLEKVRILAEYLQALQGDATALAATWFTGRPFPSSQNKILQLGWAALRDAFCAVAGVDESALHQIYLKYSDLGEMAAEVLEPRHVPPSLSVEDIDRSFQHLHAARGPLAKTPLLMAILERCSALEAKFLVKIITGDLRIGLKEGLVEEAIASAYAKEADQVRQANLLLGDIGQTARLASEDRLGQARLVPFRPIKFMLASPEPTAAKVWERVVDAAALASDKSLVEAVQSDSTDAAEGSPTNNCQTVRSPLIWLEDKYDGIRCQLHKVGRRVALYSRDLKEITGTFLELADSVRNLSPDFILDGEVVAMRGDEVLPFAELQRRLGRKESDLFMREEVPIKYVAFDLLWHGGESRLEEPLCNRRLLLEALGLPGCFRLAQITQALSPEEIDAAFDAARRRGNEGLMIKSPGSPYTPGRRGLAWLKLKKALATLDCVVVAAEYGHGKRSKVLSDYTFAVRDDQTGELKTIGKAYTGLTDAEIAQLTAHFLEHAIRQHGRYFEVEPDTVLEIAFDKIQPSARHTSGLALRFPRINRIRADKSPEEIDSLLTARKLAGLEWPPYA